MTSSPSRSFFHPAARARTTAAVKAIEAQTSAEIVVAVRPHSGNYRAADYHAGFVVMGILVAYMLVSPTIFSLGAIALEGVCAFVIGALLSAKVSVLRRWIIRKKTLQENVLRTGRSAFYELGVSNTGGRNGILIFVSTFERTCEVIPDVGIRPDQLGAEYLNTCDALQRAAHRMDFDAFLTALTQLGPALGKTMPRRDDDINELPDEVQ